MSRKIKLKSKKIKKVRNNKSQNVGRKEASARRLPADVSLSGEGDVNTTGAHQGTKGAGLLADIPMLTGAKPQNNEKKNGGTYSVTDTCHPHCNAPQRNNSDLKISQAMQLFLAGKLQQSEAVCREILSFDPDNAKALHHIGVIAFSVNNHVAALRYLKAAIAADSTEAGFFNSLGVVLSKLGKHAESLTCYRQAVQLDPSLAQSYYNMANALKEVGEVQQAIAVFEKAIQLKPDYAKAYNNLGVLLQGIGKVPGAVECFKKALAIEPGLAETYKNLGNAYVGQGEIAEAEKCFSEALRLRPSYPCAIAGQAGILEKQGRFEEAYQLMKPVIESGDTTSDNSAATFARLSGLVGKRKEAEAYLRKMLENGDFHVDARISLLFNLGELNDKLGKFDAAFEYFRQGNNLKPYLYDPLATIRQFDDLITCFSPEKMALYPKAAMPEKSPLFILGMPRSGTTLVEQILASHPLVFGAGELETMKQLTEKLPATTRSSAPYPFCLEALQQRDLEILADEYMRQVLKLSGDAQVVRITDKMPHNFLHIGLIQLLFPEAPIIHCLRDPMDTCLSIYFHDFSGKHSYAYELESLGHYYRQYQRLMHHWREVLGVSMFEVRYEEMVADQERVSRALIDFCGLNWDDRCLQFHKTKRLVNTASYQQVRKPIYSSSAGRWHNYQRHLEPLRNILRQEPEMVCR